MTRIHNNVKSEEESRQGKRINHRIHFLPSCLAIELSLKNNKLFRHSSFLGDDGQGIWYTDDSGVQWCHDRHDYCRMDRERGAGLRILRYGQSGACLVATYRQLSKEKRADLEEIKRHFMTAYATDGFNAFNQFTAWQLRQNETVDEFLADLYHLARLVGEPLPECWMTCAFVFRAAAACQTASPNII